MNISLKKEHHQLIYFIGLLLMAISLPFSKFTLSVSQFVLLGNWLWEGNFKAKWVALRSNKLIWAILSIYLLHLIGLLWTSDMAYGFKDIRVKLPLLVLPLIIGTSLPMEPKRFRLLLGLFVLAVFVGTMISMYYYLGFSGVEIYHKRELSRFMSHIRFSLLIVLSVAILLWEAFFSDKKVSLSIKVLCIAMATWFSGFLFILDVLNGIVALGLLVLVTIIKQLMTIKSRALKFGSIAIIIVVPFLCAIYVGNIVKQHYGEGTKEDLSSLDQYSPNGTYYFNDTTNRQLENGHYVWIYIAYAEIEKEWQKVSDIPFNGEDNKHNVLNTTLIRYMTSKGLRKDSVGFAELRDEEIKAIENGISSCRYFEGVGLGYRIEQTLFELDSYVLSGNPSGHSTTQRFEYWKAASTIISGSPIFGVGTGDVKKAYERYYDDIDSPLEAKYRRRAHNQYFSIGVALGFFGIAVFLFSLLFPFFATGFKPGYLYSMFFIILAFSMLSEDTLETQAGVSLFAFFNTLLLFAQPAIEKLRAYQFKE